MEKQRVSRRGTLAGDSPRQLRTNRISTKEWSIDDHLVILGNKFGAPLYSDKNANEFWSKSLQKSI